MSDRDEMRDELAATQAALVATQAALATTTTRLASALLRAEEARAELKIAGEQLAIERERADQTSQAERVFIELCARVMPCGHELADLTGGPGTVTKCGACVAARQGVSRG